MKKSAITGVPRPARLMPFAAKERETGIVSTDNAAHVQECRLCGKVRPLCRSHIVPEFAYEPMKNENNQMLAVGRNVKKVQTGYFEKLLCQECEALLSAYESTFKQTWMNTIPPNFTRLKTRPLEDAIRVEIPDYASFKLFHLSVLWRAAVSSGFKVPHITLGPYDSEIAAMILNRDLGQPGDFPFLGFLSIDWEKRPVGTVCPLAKGTGRFEGHHFYLMSYAYCDWTFIIARPGPKWLVDLEKACMQERMFVLLTVAHKQSKSFNLWKDIFRKFRMQKG
jgi:hypothetical protein